MHTALAESSPEVCCVLLFSLIHLCVEMWLKLDKLYIHKCEIVDIADQKVYTRNTVCDYKSRFKFTAHRVKSLLGIENPTIRIALHRCLVINYLPGHMVIIGWVIMKDLMREGFCAQTETNDQSVVSGQQSLHTNAAWHAWRLNLLIGGCPWQWHMCCQEHSRNTCWKGPLSMICQTWLGSPSLSLTMTHFILICDCK